MSSSPTPSDYHERLGVPLRWWVQGTMLVASLWLAVIVATPDEVAWLVTAVAMLLLGASLLAYGGVRLTVAEGVFRAGRAHIEGHHLGAVEALDAEQTRRTAGPEADARAYLVLRPYLKRAVKVQITDPADPTPYWLVSSRRPEELAGALSLLAGRSPRG